MKNVKNICKKKLISWFKNKLSKTQNNSIKSDIMLPENQVIREIEQFK